MANFDRVLSDEFSLFSVPYYSYLSPYTKFTLLETRYKSMSEYFRRSYVHEWRFAFTGKSGNSPLERTFKYFYAGKNFVKHFQLKVWTVFRAYSSSFLDFCFSKIHRRVNNAIYEFRSAD